MSDSDSIVEEASLAVKFGLVGMIGFAVDAGLLKVGLVLGLTAAIARLISLICAMQVTFAINRKHVFRCRPGTSCLGQWCAYMASNGFGNLCNYWIFVTLSSLHGHEVSKPWIALPISAVCAYVINYAGARLVVFGKSRAQARAVTTEPRVPAPGGP